MRHANAQDVAKLAHIVAPVRALGTLREPRPGTFYRGSVAFLHFHEDSGSFYADLKQDGDWQRYPLRTKSDTAKLLRAVRVALRL
jgi:hypothetical protein